MNTGRIKPILLISMLCRIAQRKNGKRGHVIGQIQDFRYPERYNAFDAYDDTAAHFFVCSTCKEKILADYKQDHDR
jgi:hypothetical protein